METDDFLAYKMNICWPEFFKFLRIIKEANRCQVIGKGIKPYINNVLLINWHRNTPVKGCTGNTKIIQPLLDKINHLITTGYWLYKVRIILNVL